MAGADTRLRACEIVSDKAQTLAEAWPLIAFLFEAPAADEEAWDRVMSGAAESLGAAREALAGVGDWREEEIQGALEAVLAERGLKPKELYQPIRVAITGGTVPPGIFESLAALGQEASLARIGAALDRLLGQDPAG